MVRRTTKAQGAAKVAPMQATEDLSRACFCSTPTDQRPTAGA